MIGKSNPTGSVPGGLALALSLLPDSFVQHHSHFGFEDSFGFYAGYGFGVGIALVIIANISPIAIGDPY